MRSRSATLPELPVVPIYDMQIRDGALVVATHGRSFWILDDLSPLRQLESDLIPNGVHLFQPQPTMRFRYYGRMFDEPLPGLNYLMAGPVTVAHEPVETPMGTYRMEFLDAGANPSEGVAIHYWLPNEPAEKLTLAILDAQGNEVRRFSSERLAAPWAPASAGMNRFVWDLRYEPAVGVPGDASLPEMHVPRAVPGTYLARLSVGNQSFTTEFEIYQDPRLPVTIGDLVEQREFLLAIRERLGEVHDMTRQIRNVKDQIHFWLDRDGAIARLGDNGSALIEALSEIEGGLVQLDPMGRKRGPHPLNEKLIALSAMVDDSDHAPTAQARDAFENIAAQVAVERDRLRQLLERELGAFNELIESGGWQPVAMS